MPDVYATIADADPALVARLADALEIRAADPQQRAMRDAYLADVPFPPAARVLEVGCGTGAVSRALARRPGIADVVGVDHRRSCWSGRASWPRVWATCRFRKRTGGRCRSPTARSTPSSSTRRSATCRSPRRALAEAQRVLRPGGWLAVFDGDYATMTLALGDADPLQACAEAIMAGIVHDRWLVRRLPALVRSCGFEVATFRSFGYIQVADLPTC